MLGSRRGWCGRGRIARPGSAVPRHRHSTKGESWDRMRNPTYLRGPARRLNLSIAPAQKPSPLPLNSPVRSKTSARFLRTNPPSSLLRSMSVLNLIDSCAALRMRACRTTASCCPLSRPPKNHRPPWNVSGGFSIAESRAPRAPGRSPCSRLPPVVHRLACCLVFAGAIAWSVRSMCICWRVPQCLKDLRRSFETCPAACSWSTTTAAMPEGFVEVVRRLAGVVGLRGAARRHRAWQVAGRLQGAARTPDRAGFASSAELSVGDTPAIVVCASDGKVLSANPSAAQAAGCAFEALTGS